MRSVSHVCGDVARRWAHSFFAEMVERPRVRPGEECTCCQKVRCMQTHCFSVYVQCPQPGPEMITRKDWVGVHKGSRDDAVLNAIRRCFRLQLLRCG